MNSSSPTTGTAMAEALVTALAETWRAIQKRHPDVPDVVLTLGSGTLGARRGEVTLGHFAAGRWHTTTAEQDQETAEEEPRNRPGIAELFVGGEGLQRGARGVLATLLHEGAHGVAATRGIKDTSRQGRYHNRRFAALGAELGITVELDGPRGWSGTTLPDATADEYAAELAVLDTAIVAYRRSEIRGPGKTSRNNPPATCECDPVRRIRVARSVLDAGPIVCGICEAPFTITEPEADGEQD
jgi:hypothetical protein